MACGSKEWKLAGCKIQKILATRGWQGLVPPLVERQSVRSAISTHQSTPTSSASWVSDSPWSGASTVYAMVTLRPSAWMLATVCCRVLKQVEEEMPPCSSCRWLLSPPQSGLSLAACCSWPKMKPLRLLVPRLSLSSSTAIVANGLATIQHRQDSLSPLPC